MSAGDDFPSGHLVSSPFFGHAYIRSNCWDQISQSCYVFTRLFTWKPLGTFSIFLAITGENMSISLFLITFIQKPETSCISLTEIRRLHRYICHICPIILCGACNRLSRNPMLGRVIGSRQISFRFEIITRKEFLIIPKLFDKDY